METARGNLGEEETLKGDEETTKPEGDDGDVKDVSVGGEDPEA